MRRFRFSLQPVLQVRRRAEEKAAREVAELRSELHASQNRLEQSRQERLRYDMETIEHSTRGLSARELLERRGVSEMLHHQIKMTFDQVQSLGERLQKKERDWQDRRQESRTVETIQQKHLDRWKKLNVREEQNLTDESATIGFTRRSRNRGGVLKAVLPILVTAGLAFLLLYGIKAARRRQEALLDPNRFHGEIHPAIPVPLAVEDLLSSATAEVAAGTPAEDLGDGILHISASELGDTFRHMEAEKARLLQWEENLQAWEARLDLREQDLDAMQAEVDRTREEILALVEEMKEVSRYLNSEEQAKREEHLKQMVRVYEGMNPRSAAPLLLELDHELAIRILSEMNTYKCTRILEALGKLNAPAANSLIQAMTEKGGDLDVPKT